MMRPLYHDGMDVSMKGMEPESTSSLDDLLRPLDADYQRPVSVHQRSTPRSSSVEYLDSFMYPTGHEPSMERGGRNLELQHVSDQTNSTRHMAGAIPKSRKSWHVTDINEDESSSLLSTDMSKSKRISLDLSGSVDSGKSSLDSSKSKNATDSDSVIAQPGDKPLDTDVLLNAPISHLKHNQLPRSLKDDIRNQPSCLVPKGGRPSLETDLHVEFMDGSGRSHDGPCTFSGDDGSGRSHDGTHTYSGDDESVKLKPLYQNLSSMSGKTLQDTQHQRTDDDVLLSRTMDDSRTQEHGDSGVEIDLRSAKKSTL